MRAQREEWSDERPSDASPLGASERESTRQLLVQLLDEEDDLHRETLRELAYEHFGSLPAGCTDRMLVHRLAGELSRGTIASLKARHRPMPTSLPRRARRVEEPPLAAETETTRFELRLIDDETDAPVAGVELRLRLPDGSEVRQAASAAGVIELRDLLPSSVGVASVIEGAELESCCRPEGWGSPPGAWEAWTHQGPSERKRVRFLVVARQHRVRAGDTLESIAARHGMTWQALAKFNFGSDRPEEVNACLRDRVGCTRRDAEGHNYVFDDSDDPGVLYIPSSWQPGSFSTGHPHTVRLQQISLHTEQLHSTLALDQFRGVAEAMDEAEFLLWLRVLFGADIPEEAYRSLRSALLDGSLPVPEIRVVDHGLRGHAAAYDRGGRVIRLTRQLVRGARQDNAEAWKLLVALLEEFGHHLDHLLRTEYSDVGGDAPLDEGTRVAYALVNLGWDEGQERSEFARHVLDGAEAPIEVEFAGLKDAVERFLNRTEEEQDEQEGDLEFFGAGRGSGKAGSYGHESIEDALEEAGFDAQARARVYFGNWLRDLSQIVDPKITRKPGDTALGYKLSRGALTEIVDVLARTKFGDIPEFRVTPDKLGVYRNEQHIDNPSGIEDSSDLNAAGEGGDSSDRFRGACLPEELIVDPATLMKRFIRSGSPLGAQPPRPHRVQTGETLESIAHENGITWQELAKYNFGTAVPAEVNRHLREKVGCTRRTKDGMNYIFTSDDQPGIIQLPGRAGVQSAEANYTALCYLSGQLRQAVKAGPTNEGYRHLGQGLHTLEDFFSHTNFVEVALISMGEWVEPWVPAPKRGKGADARDLPLTSGKFGGLDTAASLSLGLGEELEKEQECIAGEETAGTKIALIILRDREYTKAHNLLGGLTSALHELERAYPGVATLSCRTLGAVLALFKFMIGGFVRTAANNIDDAQSAFLENPASNDPTHSQLAKDHDDHPLHELAATLAAGAVKDVGLTIQRAWRDEATADQVVGTAAQYLVHPSHIHPSDRTAWVLASVKTWARNNKASIEKLGSRTWITDWSSQRSKELDQQRRKADKLQQKGP